MIGERGATATDGAAFARTLEALKRDGCNVLLVGAERDSAHATGCRRLLGASDDEPRYRLLVTGAGDTDGSDEAERGDAMSSDHDCTGATTRTLEYSTETRESSADAACDGTQYRGRSSLSTLGMGIVDTVDAFDTAADGLEPSELRVCIDSLEEYDRRTVFQFLQLTTSRVGSVNGTGHVHLPLERDHDLVYLLEPLFDALVEVRTRNGTHEQRWRLLDGSVATEWVPL